MALNFFRRSRLDLEKVYAELAAPLTAYARSLGLDRPTAEDLVHKTFVVLLEEDRQPSEPRPYLFRAVRNSYLNHVRDRSRESEITDGEPWFEIDAVSRAEELDVRRALGRLSDDQREVVMMHIWGGLSFREISDAIEVPANTVASRYRYAVEGLKRVLNANPAIEDNHESRR
jgi:RNA polymerase sigma-70 factor (ECF subfamily)